MFRKISLIVLPMVVGAALLPWGQSAQAAPVAVRCTAAGVAPAATTMSGPVTINMDATHPGLRINGHQGSLQQTFQVFDWADNPIAAVGSDGGLGVFGDNISVFPRGDVFNPSVTLYYTGAIKLGGITLYSGTADPRVSPPQHPISYGKSIPFGVGDRYYWTSAARGFPTLVYDGSAWVFPGTTP